MRRIFGAFPDGIPGLGLLVLRLTLAVCLGADGWRIVTNPATDDFAAFVAGVALVLAAPLVGIGLFTPVVAGVSALLALSTLIARAGLADLPMVIGGPWRVDALVMSAAVAVAFIGPGAYSVDCYLFAPRKIQIPTRSPAPRN